MFTTISAFLNKLQQKQCDSTLNITAINLFKLLEHFTIKS